MANIIIKGKHTIGKTRSEQEENLRKEWGPTITDSQLDKLKFLEKIAERDVGAKESFIKPQVLDLVK